MATRANDLQYGFGEESKLHAVLDDAFCDNLEKVSGYASMDYKNATNTLYVELKSRRIKHDQYPTALISASKIGFCKNTNADCYFVYQYVDGLFYVKYDKELFETFERSMYERGARPDAENNPKDTYFIPVEHLKPLPKFINDIPASHLVRGR